MSCRHALWCLCPERVNCSGQGLTEVPSALPNTTGILLLNTNHLASVSTASFQHLPELIELDLSGNRLGALHIGATLPLLQELILSHNALALLPGLFQALGQLKELNLRGNRLRTLPEKAFEGLTGLKDLDLSD
uniref:LRRNT domain-containing protein n=1 Tax=Pelusios castaneus TaxID=367368 RepID=A0A8C8RF09_9SAUR